MCECHAKEGEISGAGGVRALLRVEGAQRAAEWQEGMAQAKRKLVKRLLPRRLLIPLFLFLLVTVIVLASSYCTPGMNKEHYWSNASFSFFASERWRITVICPTHYPDVAVWLTGCPPARE